MNVLTHITWVYYTSIRISYFNYCRSLWLPTHGTRHMTKPIVQLSVQVVWPGTANGVLATDGTATSSTCASKHRAPLATHGRSRWQHSGIPLVLKAVCQRIREDPVSRYCTPSGSDDHLIAVGQIAPRNLSPERPSSVMNGHIRSTHGNLDRTRLVLLGVHFYVTDGEEGASSARILTPKDVDLRAEVQRTLHTSSK